MDIFQALEENNCQATLLYSAKLSFIIEEEIKTFHYKQKLKQFMTTKPVLKKVVQRILYTKEEDKRNHENMGKTNLTR
jgi:hypothetical protein